jgi:flagellin
MYSGSAVVGNVTIEVTGAKGSEIFSFASGLSVTNVATAINSFAELTGVSASVSGTGASTRLLINTREYGSDQVVSVRAIEGDFIVPAGQSTQDAGEDAGVLINGQSASVDGLSVQLRANGLDLELDLTADRGTTLGTSTFAITGGGATFQIGPQINSDSQVSIGIPSVATTHLGSTTVGFLNTINGAGSNSLVGGNYSDAENIVLEAINQVSVIRGRLGGLQRNQIETNINSQRVALENIQAAESAIRDADIASEVSALTRAQILVQSTTSILGLANQQAQNVLSLLQ